MTGQHKSEDFTRQPRLDSEYEERSHDPYQIREKWKEPSVCPDCQAVYHKGRWQWGDAPQGADEHRCPACARIHDRVPAGFLTLEGDFFAAHKDEILHLIRNHEEKEKVSHPLERIMGVDEEGQGITVRFTGGHLARGTGEALRHAYHGDLDIDFNDKDGQIRVHWMR
jgi:hypothetical protein